MTLTRRIFTALLLCTLFGNGASTSAVAISNTRLVACPDGLHKAHDARIIARRPGAVIYEVRAVSARVFAATCGGGDRWEVPTPTRFG